MVVGITKAGKSTLLNKLIGKNVLIAKESRATAMRWAVNFHNLQNFHLLIYKNVENNSTTRENI